MSWRPPVDGNALALSFLDLLSCGMGATVLLFLVFSTINPGSISGTGSAGLDVRGATSWNTLGIVAPLEVTVTFAQEFPRHAFCWTGLDARSVVLDAPTCNEAATSDGESAVSFSVIFPNGLPSHAFGVRLSDALTIDPDGLTFSARQAGEERTHKPQPVRMGAVLTFSLDPRSWPASSE